MIWEINSLFFDYINNNRVLVQLVSNFPLCQEDSDDCLPVLTLINNHTRESNPIVVWDIRRIEKRAKRFIDPKKALIAIKWSKNDKNLFERHPYYCAGIGMIFTGVYCGVSGWLLHAWWVR